MTEIIIRGRQWMVTGAGIEPADGSKSYFIEAERLTELTTRSNGTFYDWPIHMLEKEWVDMNDFLLVFAAALAIDQGRYRPDLDLEVLRRSISEAATNR
jgi:hypothetical protein